MAMTFTVRFERKDEIDKLVAKYQKKAAKYDIPLTVTYGEPYAQKIRYFRNDYASHETVEVGDEMIEVMDMTIDGELIRKDGYSVIARIEHLDGGNIVYVYNGEVNPAWSKLPPKCEHCGGNHGQKTTFIVEGKDGTRKQVGRTCLKEYSGIDPLGIGAAKEIHDILIDEDVRYGDFWSEPIVRAYDALSALALAIRVNRKYGYVRSDMNDSSKSRLANLISTDYPTEDELTEAEAMANEIIDMDRDEACSYLLDNAQTLLKCGYCKKTHFGFMAYAPTAYGKYAEAKRREAERKARHEAEVTSSEYVGEVGKRETFKVRETKLVTHWETAYGTTWLYKFKDENGNVLVWFASGIPWDDDSKVTAIKATVKDHNERDGVKQTVITRVKAA